MLDSDWLPTTRGHEGLQEQSALLAVGTNHNCHRHERKQNSGAGQGLGLVSVLLSVILRPLTPVASASFTWRSSVRKL